MKTEPRLGVLLEEFLGFKTVGDGDDGAFGKEMAQQRDDERPRGGSNTGARQHSAILQSLCQGLHGGRFRYSSEQFIGRSCCQVLRQATETSQPGRKASNGKANGLTQRRKGAKAQRILKVVDDAMYAVGYAGSCQQVTTFRIFAPLRLCAFALKMRL